MVEARPLNGCGMVEARPLNGCGMAGPVEARPFNGRLAGRVERVAVHGLERGAARLWGGRAPW